MTRSNESANHKLLMVIACLALFITVSRSSADDPLRETFFQEAPKGWMRIQAAARKMEGSCTMVQVMDHAKTKERDTTTRWKFKLAGEWLLYEQIRSGDNGATNISAGGINSQYFFFLAKNQEADPWQLKQVDLGKKPRQSDPIAISNLAFLGYHLSGCAVAGTNLTEFILDPAFEAKQITRLGASDLVAVDFSYSPKERTSADPRKRVLQLLKTGRLVLDPKRYWAVRECKLALVPQDFSAEYVVQYYEGDLPMVKSYTETTTRGALGTHTVQVEFDNLVPRVIPEAEFRLSAFGLPEPLGASPLPKPTPWYLWIILASVVCAALGVICRRAGGYNRRRKPGFPLPGAENA